MTAGRIVIAGASGFIGPAPVPGVAAARPAPGAGLAHPCRGAGTKPLAFVQASAVGFYGNPGEAEIDESSPPGAGFLAGAVRQWEGSTRDVEALGVRRVVTRSGLVL